MKLNLILFVVLIVCALTTVNFKHLSRNSFAELDGENKNSFLVFLTHFECILSEFRHFRVF